MPAGASSPATARKAAPSGPQRAMERLGLHRPIDLALHLPLRYEDETRLTRLADARPGDIVQIEAQVTQCRVETARRRQLLVSLRDEDGQALLLRFLNFYPTQQRAMAEGKRVRVRGELRAGLFGREMVHPVVKDAEAPLAQSLTPVYPTSAGLPQAYLRKAIAAALPKAPLHELLPPDCLPACMPGLPSLREALTYLHHPPPDASPTPCLNTSTPPGSASSSRNCWPSSSASWRPSNCAPSTVRPACRVSGQGNLALVASPAISKPKWTLQPDFFDYFQALRLQPQQPLSAADLALLERVSLRFAYVHVLNNLAEAYVVRGQDKQALRTMQTLHSLHPFSWPVYYDYWQQLAAQDARFQAIFKRLPPR